MDVVRQHWSADFEGDPFSVFHHKLKKVKKVLTQWSRDSFGNIFQEIVTLEEVIKTHETQFEVDPMEINRERLNKTQVELKMHLQGKKNFGDKKLEWIGSRKVIGIQSSSTL